MMRNDPIERAFSEFNEAWFQGKKLDPKTFCQRYPECGPELRSKIDNFILVMQALSQDNIDAETLHPTPNTKSHKIIGDFCIIGEIGRGGMGTVYEAEQISLKRRVALKLLSAHLSLSDKAVQKFQREAEAGGRQSHPGIVAIHAVGEHEGVQYIAQELVEGGTTLADKLNDIKKQDEQPPGYFREVGALIVDIADALQHAHETGVIHRDIKPSNILLTTDGNPKVTDFGLAKVEDALALSRSGDFAGTPYYMSPEQAMSRRMGIDRRTDIYSLGVTLYEMLTLSRPFEGKTTQDVLKKIMLVDPEVPYKANPRVPRDLSVICLKAMEKMPDKRYATMKEFAEDLERFLNGDVILARPAGLGTRVWKRVRRNPVLSASVGVALTAVVCFIGYELLWSIPQLKEKRDRALAAEKMAEERYRQIMRLSDIKRLSDLEADAEALWPAYPENIPGFNEWLIRADEVLGRLEDHRQTLASLRETALHYGDAGLQKDRETHPQWEALQELQASRPKLEEQIASLKSGSAKNQGSREDGASTDPVALREQLVALDAQINELEETASQRRTWKFEDTETQWQHDTITDLVLGLEELSDEKNGRIVSVRERLSFASTVQKISITDHQTTWDKAIASIKNMVECPLYDGLVIQPKLGFVPIGRDPNSGLWEFAHIQTGKIPERDQDGKLTLNEEMCLVFVLIPGGTSNMGAVKPTEDQSNGFPNVDPEARPDEGPVHEVSLKSFFLSKYEMTQGQWLRFTRSNPSRYDPETTHGDNQHNLLHPVEQVSWNDCNKILSKLKLRFPTEAEWEFATRGGTSTVFWTGNEKESLQGAANLADLYYRKKGGAKDEWLNDDGYSLHAPIGTYLPNALGLHDVHGNIFEWCDDYYNITYETKPGDRSANGWVSTFRVMRGGGWDYGPFCSRSAYRAGRDVDFRFSNLGVRPAADIEE